MQGARFIVFVVGVTFAFLCGMPAGHAVVPLKVQRANKLRKKWQHLDLPLNRQDVNIATFILDRARVTEEAREKILSSPRAMKALIDIYMAESGEVTDGDETRGYAHPFDRLRDVFRQKGLAADPNTFLSFAAILKGHPGMPFVSFKRNDSSKMDLPSMLMRMVGWTHARIQSGASWLYDHNGGFLAQLEDGKFAKIAGTAFGDSTSTESLEKDLHDLGALRGDSNHHVLWYMNRFPDELENLRDQRQQAGAHVRVISASPLSWRELQIPTPQTIPKPSLHNYPLDKTTLDWMKHTSPTVVERYLRDPELMENIDRLVRQPTFMRRYHRSLRALVRMGGFGARNAALFEFLHDLRHRKDLFPLLDRSVLYPGAGIESELAALALLTRQGKLVTTTKILDRRSLPPQKNAGMLGGQLEVDGLINDENGLQILEVKAFVLDFKYLGQSIERTKQVANVTGVPGYMLLSLLEENVAPAYLKTIQNFSAEAIGDAPLRLAYFVQDEVGLTENKTHLLYEPTVPVPVIRSARDPRALRLLQMLAWPKQTPFLSESAKQYKRASVHRVSSNAMKHDIGSVSVSE